MSFVSTFKPVTILHEHCTDQRLVLPPSSPVPQNQILHEHCTDQHLVLPPQPPCIPKPDTDHRQHTS